MSFFSFLHFFNTLVYVYLAVYIFIKNPKVLLNRICAALLICLGLWSFATIFVHNPYSSKDTAMLFTNIGSFGWISFSSFFLLFMLSFTGKEKLLTKKWLYLLVFGIPLVLIYKQWTHFMYIDFIKDYYGWRAIFSKLTWPYLFFLYYLSFMGIGLYLNIHFLRNTQNPILKKQAKIIFVTILTALIIGSINDMILPLIMKVHVTPDMADFFALIWALGIVYAMARYKFLSITPLTAASNIISTMYDCLILLNMKGTIVSVNKATLDLLGYSEKELSGGPLRILFTAEVVKNGMAEKILREENLKNKDTILRTKDGRDIPVLFSCSVLKDDAGSKGGIVCIARDISERKKLEEEILKSKKLESIGILAGGIAHDFNNLFSVIMGNIMLAMEEVSPKKKVYNFLVKAEEVSLKAVDLANKFITFSRGGCLKRVKVTLSALLKNARNLELPGTRENVSYKIDIPEDLVPIDGDKEQLGEVMQNLLLNACESISHGHSDDGGEEEGRISVHAENMTVNAESKMLLKKGEYVKVLIEDNGIGIPQRNIEKVFDPYFSTKNRMNQKGMGLGLTICYSIVKKHGGHITVESKKGKGTAVTLYLPAFIDR